MPTETMHRDVVKKENYFQVQMREGEEVKIFVDGVEQVVLVVPYDGQLSCYMARERRAIQFK